MNLVVLEFGRWAIANAIALLFWYYIGSSLIRPLRQTWPGVLEFDRKPMVTRKLHVYILSFAVICEISLMVDSVGLFTQTLSHYGWAK